jgi:hypothetical protein
MSAQPGDGPHEKHLIECELAVSQRAVGDAELHLEIAGGE